MTKVIIKHVYCDRGDHLSFRDLSTYQYDPRDLDANGNPPAWFLQNHQTELEDGEIAFDHPPTEDELRQAFPKFYERGK